LSGKWAIALYLQRREFSFQVLTSKVLGDHPSNPSKKQLENLKVHGFS
jgi:hypothetical protein